MIRKTAGYLILVIITAYLYFMYNETAISGLLVFSLVYPVISALYLIMAGKSASPDLERVPALGEKGKQIKAGISLKNLSGHMTLRYEMVIWIGNKGGKSRKKKRLRGALQPMGRETLWCTLETDYCGILEICLESVRLYDFLGIFYRKIRQNQKVQIKVMPEFDLIPLEISRRTREFQADAQEYSREKRGDDPSEIYQVREYADKDSLKDIHWKLSAREQKLMVKERGFPLGCVVLIYIDYRKKDESQAGFSKMLEAVASLSVTLAAEKCIHMAAWYEEKNERIVRWRISDEESVYEMIWNLMEIQPLTDEEKALACREDTFRGQEFAGTVTVDGTGKMKKAGESFEYLRL